MKKNEDLRKQILEHGLKMYQVAEQIGIQSPTFSRWLQTDLTPDRRERITKAFNELVKEQNR